MGYLSQFGQRKVNPQEKYCEFVQAGIGKPSIWDDLEAQSLLGVERVCGGIPTPSDGKATDSRDPEEDNDSSDGRVWRSYFHSAAQPQPS